MRRVLVIGSPGAGKSTFSRKLSAATGLPVIHLDRHYWQAGWTEPDKADWAATVERLVAEPRWIIDGNYGGTLPVRLARADTVILLDAGRWLCLRRVITRTLRGHGKTRDDMAEGCYERFDRGFLKFVWDYPRKSRPRVTEALAAFDGIVIRCRTDREAETVLLQAKAAAL